MQFIVSPDEETMDESFNKNLINLSDDDQPMDMDLQSYAINERDKNLNANKNTRPKVQQTKGAPKHRPPIPLSKDKGLRPRSKRPAGKGSPVRGKQSKNHKPTKAQRSKPPPKPKKSAKSPKSFLEKIFWPFIDILKAEPDKHRTLKMILGFPFGAFLGFCLYRLVVAPMDLPKETREFVGALTICGVAAGFAFSVGVRCVCILMIPTFMGKAGRSYIGTFAIAFLISGPIGNIVVNTEDVTRSMTCAAELSANQTANKWNFRMAPIGNVLKDMQQEGFMLKKIGKKTDRAFLPIRQEVRGEEEVKEMEARTKEEDKREGGAVDRAAGIEKDTATGPNDAEGTRIEKKYRKKVDFECEDVFNRGIKACRNVFANIVNRCKDKLPGVIEFICKMVDFRFLCNLVATLGKALGGECRSEDIIKPSFGNMFQKSEKSIKRMDQGLEVDIKYKVVESEESLDYSNVEEMRKRTLHDFAKGRVMIDFVFTLIKRVLAFTFLLVVFSAYRYYKKYTTDIQHDNIYVTSYFRKIDARRKHKSKRVLLPLKKAEKTCYISTTSFTLLYSEKLKLMKGSLILATRVFLASLVFFMANLLYNVMDIIRKHSKVDYKQTGYNHIDVKVDGRGFMSQIVRMFMKGLNTKNKMNTMSSNLECLPNPTDIDGRYYLYVYGIFFLIWILILVDAYALRLRRMIAGFFFRKREKQRVLHLYNTMQKKRKFFIRDMKRKVKRKAMTSKLKAKTGLFQALAKFFKGKEKCLICNETGHKSKLVRCGSAKCKFVYCTECWRDIKKKCYACMPVEEFSDTDTDVSVNLDSDD